MAFRHTEQTDRLIRAILAVETPEEGYRFLAERIRPAYLHIFPYSPRPGTRAAKMPDQVRDGIKTERVARLEEGYRFLEDVCTIKEIYAIAQRLEVARDLAQGASYQKTIEKTGASSATIGRVKRCLDYGTGGYRLILDRLDGEEKK